MKDLLQRLNRLLPKARAWVDRLHASHAVQSMPVAEAGFPRLPLYFPESLLRETRVVRVRKVPFPPFSRSGLPELAMLEHMQISAITFTDMIFIHVDGATESTHAHELCHAAQSHVLGLEDYLLSYVVGAIQHGYAKNPFEVTAFDLQSQFDRGIGVPDAVTAIRAEALHAREQAAEFFRRHDTPMGG